MEKARNYREETLVFVLQAIQKTMQVLISRYLSKSKFTNLVWTMWVDFSRYGWQCSFIYLPKSFHRCHLSIFFLYMNIKIMIYSFYAEL